MNASDRMGSIGLAANFFAELSCLHEQMLFEFVAALQEEVKQHPLAEIVSFRGFRSGPGGDALGVQFYGATAETLKAASEALKDALIQFPEVSAGEDKLADDKQE